MFKMRPYLILILIAFVGCKCRDNNSTVPYVSVNITINVNQPDFFALTVPTGWVYVTGGSRGIIIYRKSATEFLALERHSTYLPENNCSVAVESDGVIIKDPCSDSKWLIQDGSVINGPASRNLLDYDTNFNDPYLSIIN
jgi:hypothetical protein